MYCTCTFGVLWNIRRTVVIEPIRCVYFLCDSEQRHLNDFEERKRHLFTQEITHPAFTIINFFKGFMFLINNFFFYIEIYFLKITSFIVISTNNVESLVCCGFMFYNSMYSILSNITRIDSVNVASATKSEAKIPCSEFSNLFSMFMSSFKGARSFILNLSEHNLCYCYTYATVILYVLQKL